MLGTNGAKTICRTLLFCQRHWLKCTPETAADSFYFFSAKGRGCDRTRPNLTAHRSLSMRWSAETTSPQPPAPRGRGCSKSPCSRPTLRPCVHQQVHMLSMHLHLPSAHPTRPSQFHKPARFCIGEGPIAGSSGLSHRTLLHHLTAHRHALTNLLSLASLLAFAGVAISKQIARSASLSLQGRGSGHPVSVR